MLWVFQGQLNSYEDKEFESIVKHIGDDFLQIKPFGSTKEIFDLTSLNEQSAIYNVMCFGSLTFCKKVYSLGDCIPGVYCNLKNFHCTKYYSYFYKYLINKNCIFLPFGCLKESKDRIYDMLGSGDCIFIRPSSGFKEFTGVIVDKYRFEKDLACFGHTEFDADMMCVVAEPRNIINEYRFFIANDEIVGKSSYRINKAIDHYVEVPEKVINFVEDVLQNVKWRPEPLFVIDVGEYRLNGEDHIGIVELNSFSASGFYGIDKKSFIEKTKEQILKNIEEDYGL